MAGAVTRVSDLSELGLQALLGRSTLARRRPVTRAARGVAAEMHPHPHPDELSRRHSPGNMRAAASHHHAMMMQQPPEMMMMRQPSGPGVGGWVYDAYVPMPAPEANYLANLQVAILNQVHYYFSTENLLRDDFLRGHMNPEGGWIAISLLASFNRLRHLTTDIALIAEVRRPRHAPPTQPTPDATVHRRQCCAACRSGGSCVHPARHRR